MEITPDFSPRFRTKQKQNKLECSIFQALGLCGQGAAKNKEKRGGGNEGRLERGACIMFPSRSA